VIQTFYETLELSDRIISVHTAGDTAEHNLEHMEPVVGHTAGAAVDTGLDIQDKQAAVVEQDSQGIQDIHRLHQEDADQAADSSCTDCIPSALVLRRSAEQLDTAYCWCTWDMVLADCMEDIQ
jgi:hypothetical protein